MRGHAVGLAAMAAAAVVLTAPSGAEHERDRVRRRRARPPAPGRVAAARRRSSTTCSRCAARAAPTWRSRCAPRRASWPASRPPSGSRSCSRTAAPTAGDDPLAALAGLDRVDVLGTDRRPGCGRGGPAPGRSRARALSSGHPLQRPPSQSSGAPGLKNAWSHLDEWWLDAASHLEIPSPALGV